MTSAYPTTLIEAFKRTITNARLSNYLAESNGNYDAAIKSYELNTKLSEMFYTPLQGLEVAVRNAMNNELISRYGIDWAEQRSAPLLETQSKQIEEAMRKLVQDRKAISNDGLIAELNFGFWVGLLGPKYETNLWRQTLRKAFPHRPKGTERHQVQGALNAIRRLRNRVAHHERILHRDLKDDHATILEIIGWVCPETRAWVAAQSSFSAAAMDAAMLAHPSLNAPT